MTLSLPPVIGHRGAAHSAPENTLASFRQARAEGARMVEFDVRLTRDGQPVVFHDDTLERTTNGSGRVREASLSGMRRLDAGGWFGPAFAGEAVPTLDEVLLLCLELGLRPNIEVKPDSGREAETATAALARALALWPSDRPPPLVSSFARPCLEVALRLAPHWPRGLLVEDLPPDWAEAARILGCATLHAAWRALSPALVAEIRAVGMEVLAYTVNDPARARVLWSAGVAAVFSDAPAMLAAA